MSGDRDEEEEAELDPKFTNTPKYDCGIPVYDAPLLLANSKAKSASNSTIATTIATTSATTSSVMNNNHCSVQQAATSNIHAIDALNSKALAESATIAATSAATSASTTSTTTPSEAAVAPYSYHNYDDDTSKDFRGGQEIWQSMLYYLLAYKSYHNNDTNVKYEKENTKNHALYLWLQNQRKHYKYFIDGKPTFLNQERIKILENVGVEWNVRGEMFWEIMYDKLKEYKVRYGDTLVPRKYEENKKLGEWVTDQRRQYKCKITNRPSLLTADRERKLNEVEFTWSLRNRTDWNSRFQEMAKFREEYGHCVVPQLYAPNKSLGKWVSKQREQYRRLLDDRSSFMTRDRIERLNDIGFSWSAKGRRNTESLVGTEMMKSVSTNSNSTDTNDIDEKATESSSDKGLDANSVLPIPAQDPNNSDMFFT